MDDKQQTDENNQIIIEEKISKVNGETQIKKYSRGRLLGKGGFAKCYEFTNLETKAVNAAKIVPKSTLTKNRNRQKLISEIKIHKSLKHENVVNFEHVFEDHENVYILLQICTNQTLNELLKRRKRLTELEAQCYVLQIINCLKYLHANRVIHRDLKLGNLFLNDKMETKVGDFGLATKLDHDGEKKRTICGTPNYIAPEILDGKCGHSYEVDIWSLGVIIYTFIIGKPPFETPEVKTTYKKIRQNSYSFPDHVPISDNARNLITKILNLDPSKRPSIEDICNHAWINHGGSIPKTLPLSTLACPPSASYIKQYLPQGSKNSARMLEQGSSSSMNKNSTLTEKHNNNFVKSQDQFGTCKEFKYNTEKQQWGTGTTNNWSNGLNTGKDFRPGTQKSDFKPQSSKSIPSALNMQNNLISSQGTFLSKQKSATLTNIPTTGTQKNEVWVKQWIDYSSKYGLGYLLSNNCLGVFFNDSTKVILDPQSQCFEYMERKSSDKQDSIHYYSLTEYPKELQKKVTLLQHFRNYLEGDKYQENRNPAGSAPKQKSLIYVKKWMKTRHAIMFRLSNKIVQVNFTDKTEILLSSEQKLVTYVNKKGERSNYPLATALESNNMEMAKRLKYTKEILTHMLNANNKDT